MKYFFYDDYSEGAHPSILEYMLDNNLDQQRGYGEDNYSRLASDNIKKALNNDSLDIHFLPTGTIANILGIISMLKPYEGVIAPTSGHINTHETGGLEACGHKIISVAPTNGKLSVQNCLEAYSKYEDEHTVKPKVIYISQTTEEGTLYSKEELLNIIKFAKDHSLYTFLDGARLASAITCENATISLDEYANIGLDMFYIGGTKNGGLFGEALVIVNQDLKENFRFFMKQKGVLLAKGRSLSQQFVKFFDKDQLWLNLGKQANDLAKYFAFELNSLGIKIDYENTTNQIFPILPNSLIEKLQQEFGFYIWEPIDENNSKIRLVISWATKKENVDDFLLTLKSMI